VARRGPWQSSARRAESGRIVTRGTDRPLVRDARDRGSRARHSGAPGPRLARHRRRDAGACRRRADAGVRGEPLRTR
jgi:hypothetical protein